jgi:hypothetical protein
MVTIDGGGIIRALKCQETRPFTQQSSTKRWNERSGIQMETKVQAGSATFGRQTMSPGRTLGCLRAARTLGLLFLMTECVGQALSAGLPVSPAIGPTARVIVVHDEQATDAFRPRPKVVKEMVDRAITNLTGKASVPAAWLSLVATQDVIGLKVYSVAGPNSGTRPAVVGAVIEGLLAAGIPASHIIVWDRMSTDLRLAGFYDLCEPYGIRVCGSAQVGYDEKTFYDTALLGNLLWGDLEFGKKGPGIGRKSFVTKLVSKEITKIINITPLLNHNLAGVSGNLYSLASGSVDNFLRFESDPDRLATAVPEIYALPALYDRVVLNIVDALVCQYEGGERGLLHYSATLNELRFSRDAVALDMLSVQELDRQRRDYNVSVLKPNFDLYNNAALLELGVSDPKRIQVQTIQLP